MRMIVDDNDHVEVCEDADDEFVDDGVLLRQEEEDCDIKDDEMDEDYTGHDAAQPTSDDGDFGDDFELWNDDGDSEDDFPVVRIIVDLWCNKAIIQIEESSQEKCDRGQSCTSTANEVCSFKKHIL